MKTGLQATLATLILAAAGVQSQAITVVLQDPSNVKSCAPLTVRWLTGFGVTANITSLGSEINATNVGIWVSNNGVPQPIGTSPPPLTVNVTTNPVPLGSLSFSWAAATLPPNETFILYLASVPGSGGLALSAQSNPFGTSSTNDLGCLTPGGYTSSTPTPTPEVTTSGSSVFTFTPTPSPTTSTNAASTRNLSAGVIIGALVGGLALLAMS